MDYKQVQKSPLYEYGEGKEFARREEAKEQAEKIRRNVVTEIAMKRLYNLAKVKVEEKENAFQVVVEIEIPQFV